MRPKPETSKEFMQRYPRITSHIIAESLGYATPTTAARIGLDGLYDHPNYCEWIASCYKGNARAGSEEQHKQEARAQGIYGRI